MRRLIALALLGLALLVGATDAVAAPNVGLQFYSDGGNERAEDWAVVQKSGAETFRLPLEPSRPIASYDKTFRLAAEHGIRIQPGLQGRFDGKIGLPSSQERAAWTEWAEKIVQRYGVKGTFWTSNPSIPAKPVSAWEIWSEPNLPLTENGVEVPISGAAFGAFLGWAGPAVQGSSQAWGGVSTNVLLGALFSANGTTGYQTYLKEVVTAAGSGAFTGVGFHPYELDSTKFPGKSRLAVLKEHIRGLRTYLNTLPEAGGKSIWITEFGWPVEREFAISEDEQATLVKQSIEWMKAEAAALNLQSIIYYNYHDSAFEPTWAYRCGLRDEVGNFRKSWFAFQQVAGAARWPVPTTALQANTGALLVYQRSSGAANTLLGMKTGTSPSIGQFGGAYKVALQANTGNLLTYTSAGGAVNTGLGMAAGTSPSITSLEDGMVAFQASNGDLWFYQAGGPVFDSGYGMAAGTSPSVTRDPQNGRYPTAFQGNNGDLWIYEGNGPVFDTGYGMAPGTSPAIATMDGLPSDPSFTIAFQANTGALWLYQPGGTVASTGLGMKAGTSPGIASLTKSKKFEIVFQTGTGELWLYEPEGTVASTGLGMQPSSNPSVSAISDGACCSEPGLYRPFQVALNTNTGAMWTYEPGGTITNTLLGSLPSTSPSIAPG